jgi:hypothetical protein
MEGERERESKEAAEGDCWRFRGVESYAILCKVDGAAGEEC